MNSLLQREDDIHREWDEIYKQKSAILGRYFSSIEQPQIIYILNDLLDNKLMEILDLRFDRPYEEQVGESMVRVMDISIPYKSTYNNLLDTVKKISTNEERIFISDLTIDGNDDGSISGDLKLKIYGLGEISGMEREPGDVRIISDGEKLSPFEVFDGYIRLDDEPADDGGSRAGESGSRTDYRPGQEHWDGYVSGVAQDDYESKLLEDFDDGKFYFDASHNNIKGGLSKVSNAKSGKYSLKLEYNIASARDVNRAYIDLEHRDIIVETAPYTLGIWAYSYRYSPIILGLQFRSQIGERLEINLSRNIYWKGWRYLESIPPQDASLYPLKLERIFLELPNDRDEYGIMLFDKLEANYLRGDKNNGEHFDFYVVQKGDTLDGISIDLYGNKDKGSIIAKHNGIGDDSDLVEGRILIIPR
ncbi:MAG: LysM peptidoglycan-binding domain-containing protein [Tissierellia bacterium]|nr:LysM peptidoglycan-binding domain-containing protein [Tissierellia bacterium]